MTETICRDLNIGDHFKLRLDPDAREYVVVAIRTWTIVAETHDYIEVILPIDEIVWARYYPDA